MNQDLARWADDQLYGPGIDSASRPYALLDAMTDAETTEQVWTLFNRGWPSCDAVSHDVMMEILEILRKQDRHGTDFLDEVGQLFFDSLPDDVTIYRGAPRGRGEGMAWTTEYRIARQFAIGHRGIPVPDATMFRTKVPKASILTVSNDRREREIIVDPLKLGRIESQEP